MELRELYYKVNNVNNSKIDISDTVDVAFLDVIKEKEIERDVLGLVDCKCIEPNNKTKYYEKCPTCNGKRTILLMGEEVICGRCKGKGVVAVNDCPICHGSTSYIEKKPIKIKLNRSMLDKPTLDINNDNEAIHLHINIEDKEYYEIKGKDIYSSKVLFFKNSELKSAKKVATATDISSIKIDKPIYQQIITLKGKGIDGGDFYQPVRCELEKTKIEDTYANVIIEEKTNGIYICKKDVFDGKTILPYKKTIPAGDQNYFYLDLSSNNCYDTISIEGKGKLDENSGSKGTLIIKLFIGNYTVKGEELYRNDEILSAPEVSSMKKAFYVNRKKYQISFSKLNEYLLLGNYGLLDSKGKAHSLFTMIKKEEK